METVGAPVTGPRKRLEAHMTEVQHDVAVDAQDARLDTAGPAIGSGARGCAACGRVLLQRPANSQEP